MYMLHVHVCAYRILAIVYCVCDFATCAVHVCMRVCVRSDRPKPQPHAQGVFKFHVM